MRPFWGLWCCSCDSEETPTQQQKDNAHEIAQEVLKQAEAGMPLAELGEKYKEYGVYYLDKAGGN